MRCTFYEYGSVSRRPNIVLCRSVSVRVVLFRFWRKFYSPTSALRATLLARGVRVRVWHFVWHKNEPRTATHHAAHVCTVRSKYRNYSKSLVATKYLQLTLGRVEHVRKQRNAHYRTLTSVSLRGARTRRALRRRAAHADQPRGTPSHERRDAAERPPRAWVGARVR